MEVAFHLFLTYHIQLTLYLYWNENHLEPQIFLHHLLHLHNFKLLHLLLYWYFSDRMEDNCYWICCWIITIIMIKSSYFMDNINWENLAQTSILVYSFLLPYLSSKIPLIDHAILFEESDLFRNHYTPNFWVNCSNLTTKWKDWN